MMTRNHKSRLQIHKLRESKQFMELEKKYGQTTWISK